MSVPLRRPYARWRRDGGPHPGRRAAAALVAAVLVLAGCGAGEDGGGPSPAAAGRTSGPGAGGDRALRGSITVSAATSLAEPFAVLVDEFTAAHSGVEVRLNVGASSALAAQILEGAPVDVVAPADEATMAQLVDEDLVAGEPKLFAGNELVIVVAPGNPRGIASPADLAGVGVVSLCGEEVPCGRYAAEALAGAGVVVDESDVTRGQDVGATLTAVAEGDAVAGIVYATDARAAGGRVEAVAMPAAQDVVVAYPIGVLEGSGASDVAEAFVAHVRGADGRAVLAAHGFLPPP